MSKEKEVVELLVEGGKASAGPTMGQKFGPLGINIQEILQKINEKTSSFKGMKVPVKVIVDKKAKEFTIEIGTPPVSELIKKELKLEKGSGQPDKDKIGILAIEQVIKIAKMKKDSMIVNSLKSAAKSVIGSCNSLGILVEGKEAKEIIKEINQGKYDKEIKEEKTEVSEEKIKILEQKLAEIKKELAKELEAAKAEEEEEKKEKPVEEEKKVEVKEEVKEVKKEVKEEKKKKE